MVVGSSVSVIFRRAIAHLPDETPGIVHPSARRRLNPFSGPAPMPGVPRHEGHSLHARMPRPGAIFATRPAGIPLRRCCRPPRRPAQRPVSRVRLLCCAAMDRPLRLSRVLALVGGLGLVAAFVMPWFSSQGLLLSGQFLHTFLASASRDRPPPLPACQLADRRSRHCACWSTSFRSAAPWSAAAALLGGLAARAPVPRRRDPRARSPRAARRLGRRHQRLPPGANFEIGLWLILVGAVAALLGLASTVSRRCRRPKNSRPICRNSCRFRGAPFDVSLKAPSRRPKNRCPPTPRSSPALLLPPSPPCHPLRARPAVRTVRRRPLRRRASPPFDRSPPSPPRPAPPAWRSASAGAATCAPRSQPSPPLLPRTPLFYYLAQTVVAYNPDFIVLANPSGAMIFTVAPAIVATLLYAALVRFTSNPERIFTASPPSSSWSR